MELVAEIAKVGGGLRGKEGLNSIPLSLRSGVCLTRRKGAGNEDQ
jgi:hypothetical protein